ncbi:hypothetical protein DERF_001570 [Dermatophagoides farinae]|uniref:Uncharacterized protein n=1 Tax=Dermatophagoides farinae TaxID=6954 RepID=A0A922L8S7_DERFA|nr:hypothetical protein DERF_001570 [Dermatophagoides farinae]
MKLPDSKKNITFLSTCPLTFLRPVCVVIMSRNNQIRYFEYTWAPDYTRFYFMVNVKQGNDKLLANN